MMPLVRPDEANYWLSCVTLSAGASMRDRVIAALEAEDIEARPLWKPLHLQPVFRDRVCYGGGLAETLFEQGICLPSGSGMSESERGRVIHLVAGLLSQGGNL